MNTIDKDVSRRLGSTNPGLTRPAKKMLYVEDNSINAMIVRTLLKRLRPKITLVVCDTGAKAQAQLRSERPDFLLIDIGLPDTNGYDLLKAIRAQPALANIPAVATSNDHAHEVASRARECGFCEFLAKPVTGDSLLRMLDRVLYL